MGKIKKRKSVDSLKKLRRSKRRRSSKKFIEKKTVSKTLTMDVNESNVNVVESDEAIGDDDNSLPTDILKSTKTVSSKVTNPDIISDEIIDITNITDENIAIQNFQTVDRKKTTLNIDNDGIIDITDITITSDKYENVPKQFSSDTILSDDDDNDDSDDDDVQIIDVTNRGSIELITISDDSDEEHTSNQNSIENPISIKPVDKCLNISTKGIVKSSYNSPLRNRKRRWDEENITRLDNNLGAFVIDKQKISNNKQNLPQNFITLEQKAVKISKPHVSSTITTSSANRKLRPIVIDGLNIGHAHGSGTFSGKGIELCIQFFTDLGHTDVIAFIPQHRQGPPGSESNTILNKLVKKGQICYTPSRKVQNLRMTCHDDRIILKYAHQCGGVVVSNDNYRDLYDESEAFKEIIENRQVMVTFVRDQIIVPEDQYNRRSTIRSLSDILRFPE
uniref:Putative ribonuclease ZC3H12D n=1 Tax=Schizaphis graminum TaxID=13262 RepID=A0A2S2N901_SCHGA